MDYDDLYNLDTTQVLIGQKPTGYSAGKLIEKRCYLQLLYKSNRPHFVWINRRHKTHLEGGWENT